MSATSAATTQVVRCQSCGQYYPENGQHTCGTPDTVKCPSCEAIYVFGAAHACPNSSLLSTLPLPPSIDPLVGTQIGGRYQILAKLGHGGIDRKSVV